MPKTIEAIYEDGVFKPLRKLKLPDHIKFKLTIMPAEQSEKEIKKTTAKQKNLLKQTIAKGYEVYYQNLTPEEIAEDVSLTSEFQPLESEVDRILED